MYITYLEYTQLGKHPLPEFEFLTKEYEAEKIVDDMTTGVDGVCKLQTAFPEKDRDIRTVRICMAALIAMMADIDEAKKKITEDGGGIIASKSSGTESISYATGSMPDTYVLATDDKARRSALQHKAAFWLAGVQDANGINLLYRGPYDV